MANAAILTEDDRATHIQAAIIRRNRFSTSRVIFENNANHFPLANETAMIMGIRLASKIEVACVAIPAV